MFGDMRKDVIFVFVFIQNLKARVKLINTIEITKQYNKINKYNRNIVLD